MELVIQLLDEIEEWLIVAGHVWQAVAWRLAGLASLVALSLIVLLPV